MARRRPQICKVDGNHNEIVNGLRAISGVSVQSLAKVGNGAPDIAVGFRGKNWLFEIKMPGEDLNENERLWHQSWRGTVYVIHDVSEAVAIIVNKNVPRVG